MTTVEMVITVILSGIIGGLFGSAVVAYLIRDDG